jgi:hypothetical protein
MIEQYAKVGNDHIFHTLTGINAKFHALTCNHQGSTNDLIIPTDYHTSKEHDKNQQQ